MAGEPFLGSEALAAGAVTWHELAKYYTALMPNVYLDKHLTPTLRRRTRAAWLSIIDRASSAVWPPRRCTAPAGSTTTRRSN